MCPQPVPDGLGGTTPRISMVAGKTALSPWLGELTQRHVRGNRWRSAHKCNGITTTTIEHRTHEGSTSITREHVSGKAPASST